jgi:phosphoenolpyruvate synthase/pyruvate phosphate dikinase
MSTTLETDQNTLSPSIRPLVVEFGAIDPAALNVVGGKAANLGALTRAGFPVPPGFCITTDAYREVAGFCDFRSILDRLTATPAENTQQLRELAAEARAAILARPVPDDIAGAIASSYRHLGQEAAVAVRSSATAEDLPFASFAGQQDTYLNVVGEAALLVAVRHCWASLWTDRAVSYRSTNGIDHRSVSLAVVIQLMVDVAIAGVLFTANSVTGRRRQAVIDASPGLGEAVVSGAVNPDHFVVDTVSRKILERRIGDKRVAIRAVPGGGTTRMFYAPYDDHGACISDQQVRVIAALGDRVEAHYGKPQDIEWAIDTHGTLWLTQSRPITTLFPLPMNEPTGEALRVYFCFTVAQGLQRPITPMGLAAVRLLASSAAETMGFSPGEGLAGPARYAEAGHRVFIDLTGVVRSRCGRMVMPKVLDVMEARSAAVLRQLCSDPRLSLVNKSWTSFARRLLRIARRYAVPQTVLRALLRPGAALNHADRVGQQLEATLHAPEATPGARLDFVERVLREACVSLVPRILPAAALGIGLLGLAGRLLGKDAEADDLQTVLRGLPHNVTTAMDLELWSLTTEIRADGNTTSLFRQSSPDELAELFHAKTLPPVVQVGLVKFLQKYGHRAVAEIDLGVPRWTEDPRHILGVLSNYLQVEEDDDRAPDAVFARGAREATAMIDVLSARAARRSWVRAVIIRFALRRARMLIGLRELPKFYLVVALSEVRKQLSIVGSVLAAQGCLEHKDDVFYVDLEEARAGLRGKDLRATVVERRDAYEMELRRKHVPRILLSDGTEPEAQSTNVAVGKGSLNGTPASAGSVTGIARVIVDPVGARVLPGEILVAPSTDPGWTPLFLTAGGLVMEMGGANSHGAVVAREYGIPAVVGVPNATTKIATGQRITVNGSTGTVMVVGTAR